MTEDGDLDPLELRALMYAAARGEYQPTQAEFLRVGDMLFALDILNKFFDDEDVFTEEDA